VDTATSISDDEMLELILAPSGGYAAVFTRP
jgi:hypothetical protein